jgi:hypothetical protein
MAAPSAPDTIFFLPETLSKWPWKRSINPLYHQVKSESSAWIRSFNAFSPKAQRAFDLCDFSEWCLGRSSVNSFRHRILDLLASLAYPLEQKGTFLFSPCSSVTDTLSLCSMLDVVRAGCDLMNLFFLFDEYTDVADPNEAQRLAAIVMDAIRNPDKPRPLGECVVGEAARQ